MIFKTIKVKFDQIDLFNGPTKILLLTIWNVARKLRKLDDFYKDVNSLKKGIKNKILKIRLKVKETPLNGNIFLVTHLIISKTHPNLVTRQ